MLLSLKDSIDWMNIMNQKIQDNKQYLTKLDQAIGDGDHGINMARGFNEVVSKLSVTEYESVSDVFKDVAMTLMGKVGGASGPLYGTAFLKMSLASKGKEVDQQVFATAVNDALQGIKQRGKSTEGEKTLVDVWAPVVNFFQKEQEVLPNALINCASEAVEESKTIKATKGRAAYLGERSVGHLDPGSVSSFYLFESLAEVLEKGA
ncbi:dihydroxyacetone kinase subunit DhaL [Aquibacillus kalidii]|uniref:dihydroxyacetone kinase subunit DhaL n=1 Tax=Aquibacillus kalidii TaxID=2762597 RepID=UPI0016472FB7|nr:dihydroxyacetone kinase subunit DhaL [Aquibacillus kalidii]